MSEYPQALRRALVPNGRRRALWHDYRSRCIYMITINAARDVPEFSTLTGIPGNRTWPPRAVNSPLGEIIAANISALRLNFPFVKILRRVIMPEHIHFVIFIEETTNFHLGEIIRHFKSSCTRQYYEQLICEASVTDKVSIFEDGYHDRILLKKNQLKKMLAYVSDNPRRRLLRQLNPEFHHRQIIRHRNGAEYEIYGNAHLLSDPDIETVRISRAFTSNELHSRKLCWMRTVENCGVLVSPFISESEKRVLNWAIDNGGRFILILDNGFGDRYAPKGRLHELCSEGRILLVAPTLHTLTRSQLTRSICLAMNQLAEEISDGCFPL